MKIFLLISAVLCASCVRSLPPRPSDEQLQAAIVSARSHVGEKLEQAAQKVLASKPDRVAYYGLGANDFQYILTWEFSDTEQLSINFMSHTGKITRASIFIQPTRYPDR